MLLHLNITNYAIIEHMELNFEKGLNILTGDTGAGKSIILGALSLALGERVDTSSILNVEKKSVIEAVFNVKENASVRAFLEREEIGAPPEGDELLFIRREVNPKSRVSRALVNETPITLAALSEIGTLLIDLHRQFDVLKIDNYAFQVQVLDTLANNTALLAKYKQCFERYDKACRARDALKALVEKDTRDADFLQFSYDELSKANFQAGEIEKLESELKMADHAKALKELTSQALQVLQDGEHSMQRELGYLSRRFIYYAHIQKMLGDIGERMESLRVEVMDMASDVSRVANNTDFDDKRIEQINERFSEGFRLLQKHRVQTTDELLAVYQKLAERIDALQNANERIAKEEKAVEQAQNEAIHIAREISFQRNKYAKQLESDMPKLLAQVGMPDARVRIDIEEAEHLSMLGMDYVSFLIDTNKTSHFEPLGKIASGGELSRVMLTIKSLVVKKLALPTLVFDEIDTGVSGEVAKQIGILLAGFSNNTQIICITHQPTIAARATRHLHIYKREQAGKIHAQVHRLNTRERVERIAKMLGGEQPSADLLRIAQDMIAGK